MEAWAETLKTAVEFYSMSKNPSFCLPHTFPSAGYPRHTSLPVGTWRPVGDEAPVPQASLAMAEQFWLLASSALLWAVYSCLSLPSLTLRYYSE